MRWLPAAAIAVGIVVWLLIPSEKEVRRYVANVGDGLTTPTMATDDVSTLISDSGYTKYHLTARLWQMFEDAQEPFWKFPHGLYLEQYDDGMNTEATVVCDSATYYSRKRLWQLDGNVIMVNTDADSFLTQQLFWDQMSRKIYSDSFVHIVRTDRIIEGYGLESDQSMKFYSVNRPTAILPAGDFRKPKTADTIAPDSATAPQKATAPAQRASAQRPRRHVDTYSTGTPLRQPALAEPEANKGKKPSDQLSKPSHAIAKPQRK